VAVVVDENEVNKPPTRFWSKWGAAAVVVDENEPPLTFGASGGVAAVVVDENEVNKPPTRFWSE